MPRKTLRTPSYRLHKPTGQAVVRLNGRDFYLGRHDTHASKAEYDHLIAEWLANGRRLPRADGQEGLTITELIARFWKQYVQPHYRKSDGAPTSEPDNFRLALRPLKATCGSRQVWAIVELQRLTGMRSGEVVIMRGSDLDMGGKLWLYRPTSHKTEHHGHERAIEIGPRAQKVIRPFLKPDLEAYLFSPVDAEIERRTELHAKRKTPISYGNRPGTNRKPRPKRTPQERYTADSLCRAIARACDVADRKAKEHEGLPPDGERIKGVCAYPPCVQQRLRKRMEWAANGMY